MVAAEIIPALLTCKFRLLLSRAQHIELADILEKQRRLYLVVTAVFGLAFASPAEAQGDYYRSGYFLAGMYVRASNVCNNKSFAEFGLSLVASKEFRAFSAAYPKTLEKWMREGGENFNRGVMQDGIPAACKYMENLPKEGR